MTQAERWMLPDGIAEILPADAKRVETLRRNLLDLYHRWGYELIIPPMVEFADSLLIGMGRDVDLRTFRVTDQLSGRSLGIRADITPQAARIDSHSFPRSGANRLCYAGQVLYTRPRAPMGPRAPIQIGAELYGVESLNGDIEVISLMIETLRAAGIREIHLDLGHVAIFRSLAEAAGLDEAQKGKLIALLQSKAVADIERWVDDNITSADAASWLRSLPRLAGGTECLARAREVFANGPERLKSALEEITKVADAVARRYPEVALFFDLGEMRGYDYETGLVFAAYSPGYGQALANGGRYNGIGAVFGRDRAATGFSTDLAAINALGENGDREAGAILAPASDCEQLWQTAESLRAEGEIVISLMGDAGSDDSEILARCDRELVQEGVSWVVKPRS
ncbi:ATP phosphoribosyltransferase regulatory subunit [uncultured Microbulbifer sp.]|uniref:ATP phosphoribosyltransferase regulatory subunit n=1 Tax=uncultured Microbulbifer sp. TaxID=348147 RepID=UPI002625053C|nr:ATP phosphoribosyltransferase regulatory subunit [uncultured Microbulbifer sp.]